MSQMTAGSPPSGGDALEGATPADTRKSPLWLRPFEAVAALLMLTITVLLLTAVISRYVFGKPLVWSDEVVSICFIWLTMLGAAIAVHRNEHLRLALFVDLMPERVRSFVHAFALMAMAAMLVALIPSAVEYAKDEWFIHTPALDLPNSFRVASIAFGFIAMLGLILLYAGRTVRKTELALAVVLVAAIAAACWALSPQLMKLGTTNIAIFLIGFVAVCLVAGVPIAFCFGIGAVCYLAFSTHVPLSVVIGRMDEGMSSLVLVSVPIFVLLGCVLDATGMGKAIVDFLASLLGHIKAGMSYVLLGSLFIVSGISGSKVSDMATVAPALFPEMKRRGHKPREMVALLATGAAMADTVPPSIVLIVLGAVAGVSIAGLFQAGFVIAMVLLLMLLVLARWKARHENMHGAKRAPMKLVGRFLLIAAPALALPFLIRTAVGEGVATATEVSTVAVVYALFVGQVMYGGIGLRKFYDMLVETAALSGVVLLVLGAASAMAWSITQSGVVQQLSTFLTTLPGGWIAFMAVTIVVFVILGCLLEGLPAVLLLAPIMFPIARKLGIHDIHYSMVIVCAMNVGLMMPPIGVGFYIACRIGDAPPDEVIGAIWPYLVALMVGVLVIAAVPWISTVAL
ncbi:MAG: TRAP transporter large permease subunit [Hydrogenophaga sp.]|jgi:tripartite ATP-independent transporter DctM subunit|nr:MULTISPECIES: TRAP transporter large permease subunit [Hydrogenophaga]MBL0946419.1 TRAP transporter large permease subunit [Hydrogenophaga sp.]